MIDRPLECILQLPLPSIKAGRVLLFSSRNNNRRAGPHSSCCLNSKHCLLFCCLSEQWSTLLQFTWVFLPLCHHILHPDIPRWTGCVIYPKVQGISCLNNQNWPRSFPASLITSLSAIANRDPKDPKNLSIHCWQWWEIQPQFSITSLPNICSYPCNLTYAHNHLNLGTIFTFQLHKTEGFACVTDSNAYKVHLFQLCDSTLQINLPVPLIK